MADTAHKGGSLAKTITSNSSGIVSKKTHIQNHSQQMWKLRTIG